MGQHPNRQSRAAEYMFTVGASLIKTEQTKADNRPSAEDVDFFNNRDRTNVFLETSKEQEERIRRNSPFGGLRTWRLVKMIVKSNDDIRQEEFAMQMISCMQ